MKVILLIALLILLFFGCANWVVVVERARVGDNFLGSLFMGLVFTTIPLALITAALILKMIA